MSNLNQFILQFVNSKDIREHLQSIGYQFNALEASWLIWQSRNTTLEERHQAWERVIREYPDGLIEERMNTKPQPSLHGFLREYMEMENRYLEQFQNPDGVVYQLHYHFYKTDFTSECRVYSRFEPEKMNCLFGDDDDLREITCTRLPVDGTDDDALGFTLYIDLDRNMRILRIRPGTYVNEHDWEIQMDVFQGLWFDFPTPFQKGDILWNPHLPENMNTFVCTSINHHELENGKTIKELQKSGDASDMNAHGFFVDGYGVYTEVMPSYMDCEYYPRKLEGVQRLLIPLSAYKKGEASEELMIHALHYMRAEIEKDNTGLRFYTAEALKKVGIEY